MHLCLSGEPNTSTTTLFSRHHHFRAAAPHPGPSSRRAHGALLRASQAFNTKRAKWNTFNTFASECWSLRSSQLENHQIILQRGLEQASVYLRTCICIDILHIESPLINEMLNWAPDGPLWFGFDIFIQTISLMGFSVRDFWFCYILSELVIPFCSTLEVLGSFILHCIFLFPLVLFAVSF